MRRSQVFAGRVDEHCTLAGILEALQEEARQRPLESWTNVESGGRAGETQVVEVKSTREGVRCFVVHSEERLDYERGQREQERKRLEEKLFGNGNPQVYDNGVNCVQDPRTGNTTRCAASQPGDRPPRGPASGWRTPSPRLPSAFPQGSLWRGATPEGEGS